MSQVLREIGEVLESTREHKGLKVEDLAQTLKIRHRYLLAIERGELEELPVSAYIIGYLRSYANALGLDGDAVIARFKEGDESVSRDEVVAPEPHKKELRPLPLVLAISLLAAVGLYVYWYQGSNEVHSKIAAMVQNFKHDDKQALAGGAVAGSQDKNTAIVPVVQKGDVAVANNVTSAEVTLVADISKAIEPGAKIILLAKGTTWIQIVTKNNDFLLEKKLHPGESYNVPVRDDLLIRSGNPGAVEVYIHGDKQKSLLGTLASFRQSLSQLNPASGGAAVEE